MHICALKKKKKLKEKDFNSTIFLFSSRHIKDTKRKWEKKLRKVTIHETKINIILSLKKTKMITWSCTVEAIIPEKREREIKRRISECRSCFMALHWQWKKYNYHWHLTDRRGALIVIYKVGCLDYWLVLVQ